MRQHLLKAPGALEGSFAFSIYGAQPSNRFASLTVLPGLMERNTSARRLKAMDHVRVSMFVGGQDLTWAAESQRTLEALEARAIEATLTVREGEGHVVSVPPGALFDQLDESRPE